MKTFDGKIAFITGGASGAGLGQAKVFAKAGMKVVITDVRQDALHRAVGEIIKYAGCEVADVFPLCFDVTDRKAFANAAELVEKVFGGPPHLLILTAGVNSFGPVEASTFDDFDWVVGVCLDHVVNGLITFVPSMIKAYGGSDGIAKEEFHVVATSSGAAFRQGAGTGPYSAAKAAVNNLMYSYGTALAPYGAGATVLCPGNINSNIGDAERLRPEHLQNTGYHVSDGTMAHLRSVHAGGIDPVELAEILKEGIENGRIVVLPTHSPDDWAKTLRERHEVIEEYTLTSQQRLKKEEERKSAILAGGGPRVGPPPGSMKVPDGAEGVGQARKDIDYINPERIPKWG